jgi:hypothetical protein
VARERGQAVETIPQNVREQMIATIIEDQKASLDSWLSYLTSEDAVYPPWFKYFVFRNILKLSQFDKELGKFKSRTETTTAPFPDIYREPLAQICDLYEQVRRDNKALKEPEIQSAFSKKFPTYYAELIQKSLANQLENQEEIKGQWVKYEQGNTEHAETLYKSLESKGTGWCTAGLSTAKAQMQSGDFYVYYTEVDGEPTQPRIAIRMNGTSEIGEVRGILPHQNLEGQMMPILTEKLKDFGPEAEKYQKKSADMKQLTEIEQKTMEGKPLTQAELLFLYEVNSSIDGFGYDKDPRIADIRSKRNLQEDLPNIFDCKPSQVALKPEELKPDTIAYVGSVNTTVISKWSKIPKYLYEQFPNKRVTLAKPIELDYLKLKDDINAGKGGEYTLNPENFGLDYEKVKVFIPDLSSLVGKSRAEVADYVAKTYAGKYRIADKEYQDWLVANPQKTPEIFKDTNVWFYFTGSLVRVSDGDWCVPDADWCGSDWYHCALWLGDEWRQRGRVVLLEI